MVTNGTRSHQKRVALMELAGVVFVFLAVHGLFASSSNAAIGALDIEDQFPFVAQIRADFASTSSACSAVVSTGGLLIGTAAHCIYKQGDGVARRVTIEYVDADGSTRKIAVRKILYPQGYAAREAEAFPTGPHGPITDNQYYQHTLLDIAFLVPSERVRTLGYAHWITELLNEPVDKERSIYWMLLSQAQDDLERLRWTGESSEALDRAIKKFFGKLDDLPAMIVGYGDYNCRYYGSSDCKSDGQRRLARTTLVRSTSNDARLRAPWIWITGADNSGSSPLRHGDSGGATFIRALDGRWFFVGYNSKVGPTEGQSSSLLANLSVYGAGRLALTEVPISDFEQEGGHPIAEASLTWIRKQVSRVVDELLEVWSSPNETAIRRIETLYTNTLQGYYGLPFTFRENVLHDKEEYFQQWPIRSFKRSSRPIQVNCKIKWKSAICTAKLIVLWKHKRDDAVDAEGQSEIELAIDLGGLTQTDIDQARPPKVTAEKGAVLASAGSVDNRTKVGPLSGICGHPYGGYALHRSPDDEDGLLIEPLFGSPNEEAAQVGGMSLASIGLSADQCTAGWCKVRFACMEGWMKQGHLARSSDISFKVVGVQAGDAEGLSMREFPSVDAEIVASIPYNGRGILAHLCPAQRGGAGWCLVSHGGKSGWAAKRYLARQ